MEKTIDGKILGNETEKKKVERHKERLTALCIHHVASCQKDYPSTTAVQKHSMK